MNTTEPIPAFLRVIRQVHQELRDDQRRADNQTIVAARRIVDARLREYRETTQREEQTTNEHDD